MNKTIPNKQLKLAKRYSSALLKLENVQEIFSELNSIAQILTTSPDLIQFLENKIITKEDKKSVINQIMADFSPNVVNFLNLLIDGDKFNYFNSILIQFEKMIDEKNGIKNVQIISAINLEDDYREKITQKLEEKLSKKIKAEYFVDEKILAGLIIKIEDCVIDASHRAKLNNLEKHLI